ncbi:hypothetical protein BXZ70DRAFT_608168 [Cristinia sonorae]|uniref:NAD-P-binding protein n=1 Tax=Cristinia sonorae TaxID=1940300 RepID=A0A8K0UUI1_9AGAR|nr:hypothetical protein BXZ70DRAFT_608168 [Cristinia sonorae]
MAQRVWFITGASSGFGRSLLELVLRKGEIAVATLRKPEVLDELKTSHSSDKLLVLKLDVTKKAEIKEAFGRGLETFGRIDVVFNNAGYGILGEVEGTPEDDARKMFDTNFWGAANVSQEAVRIFRERNPAGSGGRLFVTSSMVAVHPTLLVGYYSASKAAIDSLTQALKEELDPEWNIKVTLIESGSFETSGRDNASHFPPYPAYDKPHLTTTKLREIIKNTPSRRGDPEKAVDRIYDLAGLEDPPMRLLLGKDAIGRLRAQQVNLLADAEKYESWSEGLGFTD